MKRPALRSQRGIASLVVAIVLLVGIHAGRVLRQPQHHLRAAHLGESIPVDQGAGCCGSRTGVGPSATQHATEPRHQLYCDRGNPNVSRQLSRSFRSQSARVCRDERKLFHCTARLRPAERRRLDLQLPGWDIDDCRGAHVRRWYRRVPEIRNHVRANSGSSAWAAPAASGATNCVIERGQGYVHRLHGHQCDARRDGHGV